MCGPGRSIPSRLGPPLTVGPQTPCSQTTQVLGALSHSGPRRSSRPTPSAPWSNETWMVSSPGSPASMPIQAGPTSKPLIRMARGRRIVRPLFSDSHWRSAGLGLRLGPSMKLVAVTAASGAAGCGVGSGGALESDRGAGGCVFSPESPALQDTSSSARNEARRARFMTSLLR